VHRAADQPPGDGIPHDPEPHECHAISHMPRSSSPAPFIRKDPALVMFPWTHRPRDPGIRQPANEPRDSSRLLGSPLRAPGDPVCAAPRAALTSLGEAGGRLQDFDSTIHERCGRRPLPRRPALHCRTQSRPVADAGSDLIPGDWDPTITCTGAALLRRLARLAPEATISTSAGGRVGRCQRGGSARQKIP
jgi:hypothetical protein